MSWLVLPLKGALVHCSDVGRAVVPVLSAPRIFCTQRTVTAEPASADAAVGKTAMIPSGSVRPTVCVMAIGDAASGVWFNTELMDLKSLFPAPEKLVFQRGNLLLEPPPTT